MARMTSNYDYAIMTSNYDYAITMGEVMRQLGYCDSPLTLTVLRDRRSIVTDVNVIVPNKVVEVTFADGNKQKTVCSENDEFSLELAISICITKNLIGGTSNYNKAVDNGIKVYERKLQRQEEDRNEEERIKAKRIKLAIKRAERIAKKKEEEKERLIEIQKEAIIRAKRESCKCNNDECNH